MIMTPGRRCQGMMVASARAFRDHLELIGRRKAHAGIERASHRGCAQTDFLATARDRPIDARLRERGGQPLPAFLWDDVHARDIGDWAQENLRAMVADQVYTGEPDRRTADFSDVHRGVV